MRKVVKAVSSRHVARRRLSVRSILMRTGAIAAAIALGLVATGGSYALWNRSVASGSSATITSGSANVTVSTLSLPTTPLYPGVTVRGSAPVSNGGSLSLSLRATVIGPASTTAFSQALTIGFGIAATAAGCSTSAIISSATFASGSVSTFGTLPTSATPSAPLFVCVAVTLASTAAASSQSQAAANFAVTISGTQG